MDEEYTDYRERWKEDGALVRIPFHRPLIGREEEEEVIATLRSGWLTTGPRVHQFEQEFAAYRGVKHAVALNSCTAGLHLALVALGIGEGDEVITSPITWPSTANVIVHCGAKPVFVDVQPDTLNMDTARIWSKVTERTKAIIPVHVAGHPCDMGAVRGIAESYGWKVVEDAAHALESEYQESSYRWRKTGTLGDAASFSFYATKNITSGGEGGMLTTDDDELAEKVRILSNHGIDKDAWKRYGEEGYHHWEAIYPGYKYNMPDIAAAMGIHQLHKAEYWWTLRKRYTEMYDEGFRDIPKVRPLARRKYVRHGYHLYIIVLDTNNLTTDRDGVMNAIQAEGVGVGVHFRALHLQPWYRKKYEYKRGDFPNAEYASDRIISLPLCPSMSEEDVEDVIEVVRRVIGKYWKRKVQ